MTDAWFALPIAVIVAGFGLLFALQRRQQAKNERRPARLPDPDLPRPPGRSLLERLEGVTAALYLHLFGALVQPLVCVAVVALYLWANRTLDLQFLATAAAACGVVFAYGLWQALRGMRLRSRLWRAYDAQALVGQALNRLAAQGHHVCHDLPAAGGRIDHVLAGPKGVFVVQTLPAPPPRGRNRQAATVAYNGHALFFPRAADEQAVPRAERRAKWLAGWLEAATGRAVSVRAVVAVPGWLVKRTTSDGIPVVNPRQFASLFAHIKPHAVDEAHLRRIVEQLENRTRADQPSAQPPPQAVPDTP